MLLSKYGESEGALKILLMLVSLPRPLKPRQSFQQGLKTETEG